jgi:hypothetical protein
VFSLSVAAAQEVQLLNSTDLPYRLLEQRSTPEARWKSFRVAVPEVQAEQQTRSPQAVESTVPPLREPVAALSLAKSAFPATLGSQC